MLNTARVAMVVIGILCASNIFANDMQKFTEIPQGDDSIRIEEWRKNREFVTEPVPYTMFLNSKQKKSLWQGKNVKIHKEETLITGIWQPSAVVDVHKKTIEWLDGEYIIVYDEGRKILCTRPLIIMLFVILFGILLINFIAVYQPGNYKGILVYNFCTLVINPIVIGCATGCVYVAYSIFFNSWMFSLFGFVGGMCYLGILIILPSSSIFGYYLNYPCIGQNLSSMWSKYFVGGLAIMIGGCVMIISAFVCWDSVFQGNVRFGVMVEWILYLMACFVCLPLSAIIGQSMINLSRKKR